MGRARAVPWILAFAVGCTRSADGPSAAPAPAPAPAASADAAPAPAAEPAWTARAQDGSVAVAQRGVAPGPCTVEARRDGNVIWSAPRCLASPGQPVFLGSDGEILVVLERFVPRGDGPDRTGPVVRVSRRGEPVRGFLVGELAPGERAGFSDPWLAPLDRGAEQAPRLTDDGGAVRLVTAGGAVVVLRFDRAGAAEAPSAAPRRDQAMYRWEDAAGNLHYTLASEIPPDRVRSAQRVTADVGSVSGDPGSRGYLASRPSPSSLPPARPAPTPSPPPPGQKRSTFFIDVLNMPRSPTVGPNGSLQYTPSGPDLDADAMDEAYRKRLKDMKCRTVDGVTTCG